MTQISTLVPTALLKELDHIQLERAPLKKHNAAPLDQAIRLIYASMIARVLIGDGKLSEHKSRGFQLLLNALDLSQQADRIFSTANHVNAQQLKDFFDIVEQHQLKRSFFVDVLVLCRLDGALTLSHQKILGELIDALAMSSQDLDLIQTVVACILDLNAAPILNKAADLKDLRCWHEFLYRPLTNEILSQGIHGGFWSVDNAIRINTAWQMEDAYCRFTPNGSIVSETAQEVKIEHCHLYTPTMTFQNSGKVQILNSTIQGDYALSEKRTALTFRTVSNVWFKTLYVNTKNARAFYLHNSRGDFDTCQFIECGHPDLIGGAIANNSNEYRGFKVNASTFNQCIARIGAGIKTNVLELNTIRMCHFINCSSIEKFLQDEGDTWNIALLGGSGIFSDTSKEDEGIIADSRFERSTINLGQIVGNRYKLIRRCKFNNANFTFKFDDSFAVSEDSLFSNLDDAKNTPLCNQLETQSWWSQYE